MPTETLQSLVAHFLGIPPEAVTPSTPLNGTLASSLGRARLDSALRQRLGVALRTCYSARTFGELQACANGDHGTASVSRVVAPEMDLPHALAPATSVGFDLQSTEELPECADYWTHPFYAEHFTSTEIAAGLLHAEPRIHYAGLWCTKEALKKGDPALLGRDWQDIEVRLGSDGRPVAYAKKGNEWQQLPANISITHTGNVAGAIAVYRSKPNTKVDSREPEKSEPPEALADINLLAARSVNVTPRSAIWALVVLLFCIAVFLWFRSH